MSGGVPAFFMRFMTHVIPCTVQRSPVSLPLSSAQGRRFAPTCNKTVLAMAARNKDFLIPPDSSATSSRRSKGGCGKRGGLGRPGGQDVSMLRGDT